jgi:Uma2 family endonuclease
MVAMLEPSVKRSLFQATIDDDRPFYEIIDGQRVELPPNSFLASKVASNLQVQLGSYVLNNRLGRVLMGMLYRLPLPVDRIRRPDVAFVSAQTIAQAPKQEGSENAWEVIPELMVEVISPNDMVEDLIDRLNEYFAAGCKLVWVIYPRHRLIYIYDSPSHNRILKEADELDGGIVLPDFRIPVASLFMG